MSNKFIEYLERRQLLSASPAAHAAHPAGTPHVAKRVSQQTIRNPLDPAISTTALTTAQVSTVLAQAASQASPGQVVTVTDRSGTILGVWAGSGVNPNELLGVEFLSAARARTASAFESTQDAFTTRTARFIIQNHFPQPVKDTPGGPLYGVEFSNFPGSDILPSVGILPGSGLLGLNTGLSGDPGGIPLYIDGIPVGAVGVAGDGNDQAPNVDLKDVLETELPNKIIADGNTLIAAGNAATGAQFVALGNSIQTYERRAIGGNHVFSGPEKSDFDESVALAGAAGFDAPNGIRATQIVVGGLTFPYTDSLRAHGKARQTLAQLQSAGAGALVNVPFLGFGTPTATPALIPGAPELNNFNLPVKPLPANRNMPTIAGQLRIRDAQAAAAAGVDIQGVPYNLTPTVTGSSSTAVSTVNAATQVINSTIDLPGTSTPELTTSDVMQVMSNAVSQCLVERGGIRKPNGAKARIHVVVVDTGGNVLGTFRMGDATNFSFDVAVQKARTANFFSDDAHAFTSTAIGFMSQGFFPPGIGGGGPGPLYRLQDELMDDPLNSLKQAADPVTGLNKGPLPNGITIFPGGDPLYKNGHLVGAIGISGDGVLQDDQIAFAGEAGFRPPNNIRSDALPTSVATATSNFLIDKLKNLQTTYNLNLGNFNTSAALARLVRGLGKVHLPYAKFPRNPTAP